MIKEPIDMLQLGDFTINFNSDMCQINYKKSQITFQIIINVDHFQFIKNKCLVIFDKEKQIWYLTPISLEILDLLNLISPEWKLNQSNIIETSYYYLFLEESIVYKKTKDNELEMKTLINSYNNNKSILWLINGECYNYMDTPIQYFKFNKKNVFSTFY